MCVEDDVVSNDGKTSKGGKMAPKYDHVHIPTLLDDAHNSHDESEPKK